MATLPDLSTANISYFAYFNAIDQGGVADINPEDALTYGDIDNQTIHDNGVEGQINTQQPFDGAYYNRMVEFRVKEDGWILVWYPDESTYYYNPAGSAEQTFGPWDVVSDRYFYTRNNSPAISIKPNVLQREMQQLISNIGGITYNYGDEGLFDYGATNATTLTHLGGVGGGSFSYTAATTRYRHDIYASNRFNDNYDSGGVTWQPPGIQLATSSGNVSGEYAASYDVLGNGDCPDAGVEYQLSAGSATGGGHVISWG